MAEKLDFEEYFDFEYLGINIGKHVYAAVLRYLLRGSVENDDHTREICRRNVISAIMMADISKAVIEKLKPDCVVMHHGIYLTAGIFSEYARRRDVRVVIFTPEGKFIDEFGKFGEDDGCFIYPTDVAFAEDGRIFVSEYGGNDRISVFTEQGGFLYCFGTPGGGPGQFARPSALCVDKSLRRLYVADACNHRIAIYNLDGELLRYIGSAGRDPGRLRYPYDLTLLADGTLVVEGLPDQLGEWLSVGKYLCRVQQAEAGGYSPMHKYSYRWIRDSNGPIRHLLDVGDQATGESIGILAVAGACKSSSCCCSSCGRW